MQLGSPTWANMSFLLFFYNSRLVAFQSMARSHQKDSDPSILNHFWSLRPLHTSTSPSWFTLPGVTQKAVGESPPLLAWAERKS